MRGRCVIYSCSSSKLRFAAPRISISSAASGILGMRVSPREADMLFSPRAADSTSVTSIVVRQGEGMVSPTGVHRVAPLHSAAGRREGSFCLDAFLGIQVVVHMHVRRADGVHFMFRGQK